MIKATAEQLNYAISALMMFSSAALASKTLSAQFVKITREKCLVLLEKLHTQDSDLKAITKELSKIISELNRTMSLDELQVPYPTFVATSLEQQVKSHIMAFELFLNHKLKGRALSLEQEEPLFAKTVLLWNGVGIQLTPRDAMTNLARLIHKLNGYLSENEKFPVPDDTQYS